MRWGAILAVAGAWMIGTGASAQSPLPLTGELQVNMFTTGAQFDPRVAMADDGTHVVTWVSPLADGDGDGVRFRRFPGDGTTPFNEAGFNQGTADDQWRPAIAMNASRDFVIAWETELAGQGIRARRSSNGGSTLGSELAASVTTVSASQFPEVDRSDEGAFVVVWELNGDASFRLFDAAGDPAAGDLAVASGLDNSRGPSVAFLEGGDFVVAFHSGDVDDFDILAQRFDENGIPIGVPLPVEEAPAVQRFPSIAALSDGGFAVAWADDVLGAALRHFDANGSPRGDTQGVAFPGNSVSIAASPDGPSVVVLSGGEVRAREYDRLGRPVGETFNVNLTVSGSQSEPHVAAGSDRYVVVWKSAGFDGDDFGIVRRIFRFRSVFADGFETGDTTGWSSASI